jgi:hypothetical protein
MTSSPLKRVVFLGKAMNVAIPSGDGAAPARRPGVKKPK